jgi:hypothetical protein
MGREKGSLIRKEPKLLIVTREYSESDMPSLEIFLDTYVVSISSQI